MDDRIGAGDDAVAGAEPPDVEVEVLSGMDAKLCLSPDSHKRIDDLKGINADVMCDKLVAHKVFKHVFRYKKVAYHVSKHAKRDKLVAHKVFKHVVCDKIVAHRIGKDVIHDKFVAHKVVEAAFFAKKTRF